MSSTALIAVTSGHIDGQATQLADARQLHRFLGVGKDFTTWIKLRIRQYGFELNRDYLLTQTGEQLPCGTKWRSDYLLSLDMAKELAMVERTPQGRLARRYFIDCERQLHKFRAQGVDAAPTSTHASQAVAIDLLTADISAVNRQAWADVVSANAARFHARREALLRMQQQLRNRAAIQTFLEINRPAWVR